MSALKRYNSSMVVLHWLLAVFILGALFLGAVVLDEMKNTEPQKMLLLQLHMAGGMLILLLTLLRLVLHLRTPLPAPAAAPQPWMGTLATAVHYLLYLLTVVTALAGLTLALSAKLNEIVFQHIGSLPEDFEGYTAHEVHGVFADLLLATIVLHVLAALYHQFVLKDGLLSRMSLRRE